MPAYNLSRAHWVQEIEKIQAKGERICALTADGDVIRVVTETRPASPEMETR